MRRELVSKGWEPPHVDSRGKPLRYPIKNTNQIYRIRKGDGTEWLLTCQWWTGLDVSGNPVSISTDFKEMYDDVFPIVKQVPENPTIHYGKNKEIEYVIDIVSSEYSLAG
jgi:hypothetical protein